MTPDHLLLIGIVGAVLFGLHLFLKLRRTAVAGPAPGDTATPRSVPGPEPSAGSGPEPVASPDPAPPQVVTLIETTNPRKIDKLKACLEADPENVEVMGILAGQYLGALELDRALDLYQKALKLRPGDVELLYQLGKTWYLKKRIPQAKQAWNGVLVMDPECERARQIRERLKKLEAS